MRTTTTRATRTRTTKATTTTTPRRGAEEAEYEQEESRGLPRSRLEREEVGDVESGFEVEHRRVTPLRLHLVAREEEAEE